MPLSYRQVKDMYDALHDSGAVTSTLPDWSRTMGGLSGSDMYDEGLNDNFIKRASVGIDRGLEAIPGLIPASRDFGGAFGGAFGHEEIGQRIGEGLPRMAANFLPMLATGPIGGAAAVAGLVGTGVMSGAQTYTETNSPAAGVLSGATAAALPWFVGKAEGVILSKLGAPLVKGSAATSWKLLDSALPAVESNMVPTAVRAVNQRFPANFGQSFLAGLGGQATAAGIMEASGFGQDLLAGQPLHNPLSAETALNLTLGQLPFAALHLGSKVLRTTKSPMEQAAELQARVTKTEEGLARAKAFEAEQAKPWTERNSVIPDPVTVMTESQLKTVQETQAILDGLGQKRKDLSTNLTEDKVSEYKATVDAEDQAIQTLIDQTGGVGIGTSKMESPSLAGRTRIIGENHTFKENGDKSYYHINVSDHPDNVGLKYPDGTEIKPGDRIRFPAGLYDPPANRDASNPEYFLPSKGQFTKVVDRPQDRPNVGDPNLPGPQPELPIQTKALDLEQYRQDINTLKSLEEDLQSNLTNGGTIDNLSTINAIRARLGQPEIDLASLARSGAKRGVKSMQDNVKALNSETIRLAEAEHEGRTEMLADIQRQVDFENEIRVDAAEGDQRAIKILALYEELSNNSARRGDVAVDQEGNSPFWNKALKLFSKGQLSAERLQNWKEEVAETGKDLKHKVSPKDQAPLLFEALSSEDSAAIQIGAEKVVRALAGDNSREASVLRRILLEGVRGKLTGASEKLDFDFSREGIKDVVEELGIAEGADAQAFAESFRDSPKVASLLEKINQPILENEIPEGARRLNAPREIAENQLPAGGGFVWNLASYDPVTNRMGGKHTIAKDGVIPITQLKAIGGRGKELQDVEIQMMRAVDEAVGGGAFEGEKVNVRKLVEVLEKNPIQVEVKKLGEGAADYGNGVNPRIQHEADTLGIQINKDDRGYLNYSKNGNELAFSDLPKSLRDVISEWGNTQFESGSNAKYKFLGPKSEQEMPGYVEGLVRIPTKVNTEGLDPNAPGSASKFDAARKAGGVKYTGPHFGSEDTNNLAFFRGYDETLPNGQKAFHVIEVQSDWAQTHRKNEEAFKADQKSRLETGRYEGVKLDQAHPLLPIYETLALKAAINHAKEIGATKLILPDAETAMMTEGHDKSTELTQKFSSESEAIKFKNGLPQEYQNLISLDGDKLQGHAINEASRKALLDKGFVNTLKQEGGMRLHYDTTLPSAARKLTGDKGEKIDLGRHKSVGELSTEESTLQQAEALNLQRSRGRLTQEQWQVEMDKLSGESGSPIFKNPDGSPKSSISGTVYDLSQIQETSRQQGGLTLGDPKRAPRETSEPFIPHPEDQPIVDSLTGDGNHLVKGLLSSSFAPTRELAKHYLTNFPGLLGNIQSWVEQRNGTAAYKARDRKVGIIFDPSTVGASEITREFEKLHELRHALTMHEIDNPLVDPKLIESLTAQRQRAIEALPKKLKADFDRAIQSKWMERNDADTSGLTWLELSENPIDRQVLYALMDNHEFVAQTEVHDFRKFLQKVPGKTNGWKTFTGWVKSLLKIGAIKDTKTQTLFDELLETQHQIMSNGEFLVNAQKFGETWFENQGKGGMYGKSQTEKALGLIAQTRMGMSPEELILGLGQKEGRFNPEFTRTKRQMEKTFNDKGEDFQTATSILDEFGHEPSPKGVDDFVARSLSEGVNQDAMDMLPPSVAKYVFAKLNEHNDVLRMLEAVSNPKNKNLVNLLNPSTVQSPVLDVKKAVARMLDQEQRQMEFAIELEGLNAVEPSGFLDRHVAAPREISQFMEGTGGFLKDIWNWTENFLQPTAQLARQIGGLGAEIIGKGYQVVPNARKMFSSATKSLGITVEGGKLGLDPTHEGVKETEHVLRTPKLNQGVTDYMALNNKIGGEAVQMLPESHPEIAKLKAKFTPEEWQQVKDGVVKFGASTQSEHAAVLEMMKREAILGGAGTLALFGGKTEANVETAKLMFEAVQKMRDPMTLWQGQTEIQNLQQRIQPEAFLELLKFNQGVTESVGMWKEYFDANPFWASAQRAERYLIKGFKNGKPWLGQASSIKEGREIAEKQGISLDKNDPFPDQWKGKDDEPFVAPNMSPKMAARLEELQENHIAMLKKAGVLETEGDVEAYRRNSPVQQGLKEAAQQSSLGDVKLPPRNLSKGSEDLPWTWNHIAHVQKESSYWARRILRAEMNLYLKDPEIKANPELQKRLKTHFENLLEPDPRIAQKMTKFASVWFMGFNLASTLVNATQPFVTHVAELTSMTGKPVDSYRRISDGLKEAANYFRGKSGSTSEIDAFIKKATEDGERSLSSFDIDEAANETMATNFKRLLMKNKTQTTGQRLGTLAGSYSEWAMKPFRMVEEINATAALVASFKLYREQGLSVNDATAKAYEFNHAVNFSGGRAQRSVGAFSGRGAFPRSTAMLGTSLQSYVLGTTFQLARYIQSGAFRPPGATPHEVYSARKAGLQMLGTQLAAAGLLGLPFASSAIALLNQMFPDLELNKRVREGVDGILSQDNENGSILTDIAMTGVPSMLGWDLQSRLSMGNTLPGVSEVNGFQPENLMGPMGNVVKNFVGGVRGWSQGNVGATSKFLPPAVRKVTEAANSFLNDGGEIRDYQGRPLSSPTPGEKLGRLVGFQPKRLSDQNAASRIAQQSQEVAKRRQGQENSELANEVLKGNFGTVRAALQEKIQSGNSFDPFAAVRAISRTAEEQAFPRDLRREGNKNTGTQRSSLLSSFSNLSNQDLPSEEERLIFRQGIEQKLGVPPQRGSDELQLARLMDQLRIQSPNSSRIELRAAAQQALRRAKPRQLIDLQE